MSYNRLNNSIIHVRNMKSDKYKIDSNTFLRKRKMDFIDYLWYIIMQKGKTTSMELDEYLKVKNGNYNISISKQAFSRQRQNLKPEVFIDIYKHYLESFYKGSKSEVKTYKGFNICAIDGSLFEIPNTEELREQFKAQKNSSGCRESARARVSGIYDIENGFMVDALITDCSKGEKELAKKNIENASNILDIEKTIIIFDRGYPGIELIWYLEKLNANYIFRIQTKMYQKEKVAMQTSDEWIELKVTGDRLRKIVDETTKEELNTQKSLKVRMSRVILNTGEEEYLLSNISEEIISPDEMKSVYFKRWQIEIGYDILKNKMHLENFTGKTKITIEQDFYAQIYLFNVLQDIKNINTQRIQEKYCNRKLKYKYKVNINILAGWLKNILIAAMFTENDNEIEQLYNIIVEKAEKNLIAIRPNRSSARKPYTSRRNKYKVNLRNNM